jgi:hypothetical protein
MAGFIQKIHDLSGYGDKYCCIPEKKRTQIIVDQFGDTTMQVGPEDDLWRMFVIEGGYGNDFGQGQLSFGVCCGAENLTINFTVYVVLDNARSISYSFFDTYFFGGFTFPGSNVFTHSYSFSDLYNTPLPNQFSNIINPCGLPARVIARGQIPFATLGQSMMIEAEIVVS